LSLHALTLSQVDERRLPAGVLRIFRILCHLPSIVSTQSLTDHNKVSAEKILPEQSKRTADSTYL